MQSSPSASQPDSGMRAVLTTLRVLETVAELQPVGVSAIARATDIPKSSVQRCLVTLRQAGWLTSARADKAQWVLTGKALSIGMHVSVELGLREAALATMQELRDETRETIHLSSYDDALVIIDRLDSTEPVRTWLRLGTHIPLHASCSGRAVLAHLPGSEVDRMLAGHLERYSENTLADRDAVIADLRTVRARGYATVESGWRPGVGAVAAAVLDARGRPIGALAISVPVQRYDAARANRLGPLVAGAARTINTALRGVTD
jgi:IclR family acetate operon transcriptional repressor